MKDVRSATGITHPDSTAHVQGLGETQGRQCPEIAYMGDTRSDPRAKVMFVEGAFP